MALSRQHPHAMLPSTTHDELARQEFVHDFRYFLGMTVSPANPAVWDQRAGPAYEAAHGRPAETRHEVAEAMTQEPFYQMWSAMQRNSQELMWSSVIDSVERQLPELNAVAKQLEGKTGGTLTLDPDFEAPYYLTSHDIHLQPGSYQTTLSEDDVAAGAIYDRGLHIYGMGVLGQKIENLGRTNLAYYQKHFPEKKPLRILDMGCGVGNSTLPWAEAFPEAEIHGIDVGEALLRYAHGRAESESVKVHFSQQNAECTNFEDESFDLVVSHLLMHETSTPAVPRIFAESKRLLKPGGMMMHLDLPRFSPMTPLNAFLWSWEVDNNCEYFSGTWRSMDQMEQAKKGGWTEDEVSFPEAPGVSKRRFHSYAKPNQTWPVLMGIKAGT